MSSKQLSRKLLPRLLAAKGIIHRDFPPRKLHTKIQRKIAIRRTRLLLGDSLRNEKTDGFGSIQSISNPQKNHQPTVWTLWLQGFSSAPPIVRFCQEKLTEKASIPVRALDFQETMTLIEIPERVMELYEKGVVTNVSLSDLIRLKLLHSYGGIWLDATVLVRDFEPLERISRLEDGKLWWAGCRLPESGRPLTTGATWAMASSPNSHWNEHAIYCFEKVLVESGGGFHYFDLFHVMRLLYAACPDCREAIIRAEGPEDFDRLHDSILKGQMSRAKLSWSESFMHKLNHKTFVFQEKHRSFLSGL